ncbi:MAG: fused MFS/spermidine synthase [Planctomycetota bacterium]|nr:fused MFS/spermidine synthase [Planctomycetota bacterium]
MANAGQTVDASVLRSVRALYLTAFTSGAVLMGVQIAGSRILAPRFGTAIYVWGSLIGLFLVAMTLGYELGGKWADKKPSYKLLAGILTAAGLYVALVIFPLGGRICVAVAGAGLGKLGGPLAAAALIFFVPCFLMAMTSPFAIRLLARNREGLGGVAGRLSAFSTFGSIVGTLATTFFLIPYVRVSLTLGLLGVGLVAACVAGMLLFKEPAPRES